MKNIGLLTFLLCCAFTLTGQTYILHCGSLFDGSDESIKFEKTVIVHQNKITGVLDGYVIPVDGQIVDLKEYTVLPGLMDMHVHIEKEYGRNAYLERFTLNEADIAFQAAHFAEITLMSGFTTVRDLGGTGVNVALQKAIAKGLTPGPRIYTAAKSIAITGGHADPTNGARKGIFDFPGPESGVADGPDACRRAVRQQVKNGADLIKITATGGVLSVARDGFRPQFSDEEIRAIVETANDFGIHVAAHAHGAEGMKRAVINGITSIEHGTMMTEEIMDLMIKYGTYYVPTITAGKAVGDSARIKNYYPELVTPKALAIGPVIHSTFSKAYEHGVIIAFGTDAGVFPHGKNALEFQYMVQGGMPPAEAILSSTKTAARLLGIDDKLGEIKKGYLADIIAVKGNPLNDITSLMNVTFVMKDGNVFKNASL